jgi:hypothetical protein
VQCSAGHGLELGMCLIGGIFEVATFVSMARPIPENIIPEITVSSPADVYHRMLLVCYWYATGMLYELIDWARPPRYRLPCQEFLAIWKADSSQDHCCIRLSTTSLKQLLFVLLLVVIRFTSIFNHTIELSAEHNTHEQEESE